MLDIAPHPLLASVGIFKDVKLGKKSVLRDHRTLQAAKYVDASAIQAPPVCDYASGVAAWPMYGNNSLGDCTCAAAGHMVQAWSHSSHKNLTPADTDVIGMYWATGSADTGRYELEVLRYWRTNGMGTDKIYAYASVNPRDHALVRACIYLFGGVYTGIALPITAQGQPVWDVVGDGRSGNSAPGSWGGHAVPYVAYDQSSFVNVTWGGLMKLTQAFNDSYCDEMYAIISKDFIDAHTHKTVAGLNLTALRADLKSLGAAV